MRCDQSAAHWTFFARGRVARTRRKFGLASGGPRLFEFGERLVPYTIAATAAADRKSSSAAVREFQVLQLQGAFTDLLVETPCITLDALPHDRRADWR